MLPRVVPHAATGLQAVAEAGSGEQTDVAPFCSSSVLVAMVDPCTKSEQSCSRRVVLTPRASAATRIARNTPSAGFAGTEGTLMTRSGASPAATTRSVKVPPTSTPIRQPELLLDIMMRTVHRATAAGH